MIHPFLATLLACFTLANAYGAQQTNAIPPAFHGYWEVEPTLCGTGEGEGLLVISRNRIYAYESDASVRAVFVNGPFDITTIAHATSEGEVFLAHMQFRLSEDGNSIYDIGKSGILLRQRCHVPPKRWE